MSCCAWGIHIYCRVGIGGYCFDRLVGIVDFGLDVSLLGLGQGQIQVLSIVSQERSSCDEHCSHQYNAHIRKQSIDPPSCLSIHSTVSPTTRLKRSVATPTRRHRWSSHHVLPTTRYRRSSVQILPAARLCHHRPSSWSTVHDGHPGLRRCHSTSSLGHGHARAATDDSRGWLLHDGRWDGYGRRVGISKRAILHERLTAWLHR